MERLSCKVIGCDRPFYSLGFCRMHHARFKRKGDPGPTEQLRFIVKKRECSVPGCNKKHEAGGFCGMHYERLRCTGSVGTAEMRRAKNGSGFIDGMGYKRIRHQGKETREHRIIAEKALGRPLRGSEQVHHVDENRSNNKNSNLVICPDNAYHQLLHKRQRELSCA